MIRRSLCLSLTLVMAFGVQPGRASGPCIDSLSVGTVSFISGAGSAVLGNAHVRRAWTLTGGPLASSVRTVALDDIDANRSWVSSDGGPEFQLTIDGATFTSDSFALRSVCAVTRADGIDVHFTSEPIASSGLPVGLAVERIVTLHDQSSVLEVEEILHNATPAAHALSLWTLDQIEGIYGAAPSNRFTIDRYVGGSDWRDDFRASKSLSLVGDEILSAEGEVAQFDDGAGAGFFLVSERRGGAASRIGVDGTRIWAGADIPRDLEDLGPLATTPPNYNRVENPAYPTPIRTRHIQPLSDFVMGRAATGVYHGGRDEAGAAYAFDLTRYRQPAFPRQVLLNSFHPWGHSADFNEATMLAQADVAQELGIDTIILDDQWQGGTGGESGDWQWDTSATDGDPARFPDTDHDGKADIVDRLASKGVKLGLWMSPAEFHANSQTFRDHPNWACTPIGTVTSQVPDDAGLGVWDFTNPDLRAYMTGVIDRIVGNWGVHYFKFDFQVWVDCPPHDYNDYEDAFVGWIDALKEAHPDVTFTFDETNDQRMYAFESAVRGPSWFDNAHSHKLPSGATVKAPAQVLHDVWMAAPWVPPSTLGVGLYDQSVLQAGYTPDYLMPMASLTHMTFWRDLTTLTASQKADTKWWLEWYHAHATALGGVVYRLSDSDPWDDSAPAAFQPWDSQSDSGFLFAFRQTGPAPFAALRGLVAGHTYRLMDVRTGVPLGDFGAATLAAGIPLPLASVHTASVYSVVPL